MNFATLARALPLLLLPFLLPTASSAQLPPGDEPVAHEVIDARGFPNLIVWGTRELTIEEYDALQLPPGWIRNQPREGTADSGRFLRSPGRENDGEYTTQEIFGVNWLHQATIVGFLGPLDPLGLLTGTLVEKHHELTWNAGSTLTVLTSPEDVPYTLVSRDVQRTSDTFTIPDGWSLESILLEEEFTYLLPLQTTVIRTDNEDSFQGPFPMSILPEPTAALGLAAALGLWGALRRRYCGSM